MLNETEQTSIRVLVANDTRLHTQLLVDALQQDKTLEVIASNAHELESRDSFHEIDVMLISADLEEQPGHGFAILRQIRSAHHGIRAVMLLNWFKDDWVLEAFRAGSRGVLSRQASMDRLRKCLVRVHQGQVWADSQQMLLLLGALASTSSLPTAATDRIENLSKRELEVVDCVAEGLTNREIAERLGLSQHTVKNYLFRVFEKLEISNRTELLSILLRNLPRDKITIYSWELEPAARLRDESMLAKCMQAASSGALSAQLELALFHSAKQQSPKHALEAYKWCLIAQDQLSRLTENTRAFITEEEVLIAEEMIKKWLGRKRGAWSAPVKTSSAIPEVFAVDTASNSKLNSQIPLDDPPKSSA